MLTYTAEEVKLNRQKWLETLRDPKSKKKVGILEDHCNENARCCLGHACHALGAKKYTAEHLGDDGEVEPVITYGGEWTILPEAIAEKLCITCNGEFKDPIRIEGFKGGFDNLTDVNDDTKLTSVEIADVIEEQFALKNFLPFEYNRYSS